LRKEGLAYRFVPVASDEINTNQMAHNLLTKFSTGNAHLPSVYFDETNRRQLTIIRNAYAELAVDLTSKGRQEKARKFLQKADKMMLEENFPYGHISSGNMHNRSSLAFLEACYRAEAKDLIAKVSKSVKTDLTQQLKFYNSLDGNKAEAMAFEKDMTENLLSTMDKMEAVFVPKATGEAEQKILSTD
jgi:hypothetical protein